MTMLKEDAQHALAKLSEMSVEALMNNGLEEWATLSSRMGFPTVLPTRPNHPLVPEEPALAPPPREDDPKYDVALSTLDKLISSRRIKKQDAALKRFEKDRKAWNEDRDYARGLFETTKKKHHQEVGKLETQYTEALSQWKQDFESHLKTLVQRAA
jgi:hypothetical protein